MPMGLEGPLTLMEGLHLQQLLPHTQLGVKMTASSQNLHTNANQEQRKRRSETLLSVQLVPWPLTSNTLSCSAFEYFTERLANCILPVGK